MHRNNLQHTATSLCYKGKYYWRFSLLRHVATGATFPPSAPDMLSETDFIVPLLWSQ